MTIEEKRYAVKEYCRQHYACQCADGSECPLYKQRGSCYEHCNDDEMNYNFKLVSAMPDYNGLKETTKHDPVNHPSHYTQGGMECIDEMILIFGKEAVKHFCLCNAWKYRKRALFKNGQEDIDKSDWYIAKYKELEGV